MSTYDQDKAALEQAAVEAKETGQPVVTARQGGFNDRETVCVLFEVVAPEKPKDRTRREPMLREVEVEVSNMMFWPAPDHLADNDQWSPSDCYNADPETVRFPDVYGIQATQEEIRTDAYPAGTLALVGGVIWRKRGENSPILPGWYPDTPMVEQNNYMQSLARLVLTYGNHTTGPVFIMSIQASP